MNNENMVTGMACLRDGNSATRFSVKIAILWVGMGIESHDETLEALSASILFGCLGRKKRVSLLAYFLGHTIDGSLVAFDRS
jgi:hypothetical protein